MNNFFRKIILYIQHANNKFDPSIEAGRRDFKNEMMYPVFIVGAPRTGSTLLYQLLINSMEFSYISNIMALFPNKIRFLATITYKFRKKDFRLKRSNHGYVSGLFSPNEAGAIQRKWFENPPDTKEDMEKIRNTIIKISEIFNAPFLSKNMLNSVRMKNIYRIFPEVRFIFLKRNPIYTAQSLILARRKYCGDDAAWWSVKPPGWEKVRAKNPYYQVLWQIKETENVIVDFFEKNSLDNYICITYEDLCCNTKTSLKKIADKLNLNTRHNMMIPELRIQEKRKLKDHEWENLIENYNILFGHQSLT